MFTVFSKLTIFVTVSILIVIIMYSSLSSFYTSTFYVFAAPPSPCFLNDCPDRVCINSPEEGTASCCWSEEGLNTVFCQTCPVNTDSGEFENCRDVTAEMGVAPPPTSGPKGKPGNLSPKGAFEGPATSSQKGGDNTPELTPPMGLVDNNEKQSRINTSPTGYCAPLKTPKCLPCDPGLPGNTCLPGNEWPPVRSSDIGTLAKQTIPSDRESASPQELTTSEDCNVNPNTSSCENVVASKDSTALPISQLDCAQNTNDPQCDHAKTTSEGGETENDSGDGEQEENNEPQQEEGQSSDENENN